MLEHKPLEKLRKDHRYIIDEKKKVVKRVKGVSQEASLQQNKTIKKDGTPETTSETKRVEQCCSQAEHKCTRTKDFNELRYYIAELEYRIELLEGLWFVRFTLWLRAKLETIKSKW